jgi:hypothetical protein
VTIICALDPGGTTGVAVIDWDDTTIPPPPEALRFTSQLSFDEIPHVLWTLMSEGVGLLVMERFIISPKTVQYSRQPEALYVIGGGMFLAKIAGVPVRLQTASDAKTAYPNSVLRGWAVRGPHARDALRHALFACHGSVVYPRS